METTLIGETVAVGHYRIKNEDDHSKIEWLVLDQNGENFLLLSKYAIEAMPFHEQCGESTWERCSLRRWLNWTFYDHAFSTTEKHDILQVLNETPDSDNLVISEVVTDPKSSTLVRKAENPATIESLKTLDKVFLLSCEQVDQYQRTIKTHLLEPTPYALQKDIQRSKAHYISPSGFLQGSDTDYCDRWWLRDRGTEADFACYADMYGNVFKTGFPMFNEEIVLYGVRPAIWVRATSIGV